MFPQIYFLKIPVFKIVDLSYSCVCKNGIMTACRLRLAACLAFIAGTSAQWSQACTTRWTRIEAICGDTTTSDTDLNRHLHDPKSDCSTECLTAMEELLTHVDSTQTSCRDYWNVHIAAMKDSCTPECVNLANQEKPCEDDCFPLGKRKLYEGFLAKCQAQRRQGAYKSTASHRYVKPYMQPRP